MEYNDTYFKVKVVGKEAQYNHEAIFTNEDVAKYEYNKAVKQFDNSHTVYLIEMYVDNYELTEYELTWSQKGEHKNDK